MVMMYQVAEFMHDDVINAVNRGLDKVEIQGDLPSSCATAPPCAHVANFEGHGGNTVARSDFKAREKVFCKDVLCASRIPSFDDLANLVSHRLVGNSDLKKSALKFCRRQGTLFDMKPILAPQKHKRFTTRIRIWGGMRVKLPQLVESIADPRRFSDYSIENCLFRCCERGVDDNRQV